MLLPLRCYHQLPYTQPVQPQQGRSPVGRVLYLSTHRALPIPVPWVPTLLEIVFDEHGTPTSFPPSECDPQLTDRRRYWGKQEPQKMRHAHLVVLLVNPQVYFHTNPVDSPRLNLVSKP